MSEDKFCTKCGKKVPTDAQYCDKCGEPIANSDAYRQREEAYANMEEIAKESRMMWIKFFLIIYAVPAIIMSLYTVANIDWLTEQLVDNADFYDWMVHHDISADDVRTYISTIGYMFLISAIGAIISLIFVFLRKMWILAVIGCMIAAICACFSVFGMLIGFLVTWFIISAKDSFDEEPLLKQKQG